MKSGETMNDCNFSGLRLFSWFAQPFTRHVDRWKNLQRIAVQYIFSFPLSSHMRWSMQEAYTHVICGCLQIIEIGRGSGWVNTGLLHICTAFMFTMKVAPLAFANMCDDVVNYIGIGGGECMYVDLMF